MPSTVEVSIWKHHDQVWSGTSGLPLELGRQRRDEDDGSVFSVRDFGDHFRLAIAPISDLTIPRLALRVEFDAADQCVIRNIHSQLSFHLGYQATALPPGGSVDLSDEVLVALPDAMTIKFVRIPDDPMAGDGTDDERSFRLLPEDPTATMAMPSPRSFGQFFGGQDNQGQGRAAVDLVRQALAVVQKSAGSGEFYDAAVRSAAGMIALDRAYILLLQDSVWRVRSKFVAGQVDPETSIDTSATEQLPGGSNGLLRRMQATNQTVLFDPNAYAYTAGPSMLSLDRAVATPIRGETGTIIGALYGDRKLDMDRADTSISDLEATLLEIMAGAVSAGLARQKQEAIRAAMTQFFSPSVTQRLEHNEDLLSGRDVEVSVLFCDIRGFSRICERVDPKRTFQWINDVLTRLSQCVMRTDGVLVDYIGDELMAMWGAPGNQPDHARRACEAACDMLLQIEPLRQKWLDITPDQFGVGIGINTGMARVGNTGSQVKFKYGPLGNTVNIASRVQGITKKMGVATIITGSTLDAISQCPDRPDVITRRLAEVRPVGVEHSIQIHEMDVDPSGQRRDLMARYQLALKTFESFDAPTAQHQVANLLSRWPNDRPCQILMQRIDQAMQHGDQTFDPVWVMSSK